MARWWLGAGLVFAGAACGGPTVHRPLELFVGGLSGQAVKLVVLVFPESTGQTCAGLSSANIQAVSAPIRAEWVRGEDVARGLALEAVDEGRITLVAYSEDEAGQAIQFVCEQVEYAELESPDLSIQLSARD